MSEMTGQHFQGALNFEEHKTLRNISIRGTLGDVEIQL
jgi:hypothetical protein